MFEVVPLVVQGVELLNPMTRWGAVSLVAVLTGGLAVGAGGQARADVDDITFDAVTSAYGVEFTLRNPSIPTGITVEGSGPTTRARLSSLRQSEAFASLPYPGDTGANAPGLVGALTGIQAPPYPLYIASRNGGSPPTGGHFPGIDLTAASTDELSTARASAGADAVGYVAESTVAQGVNGAVSATSTATLNGLQVGGVLTLSGVESSAKAVLSPSGDLTTSSGLTVARFDAPGAALVVPSEVCVPTQPCIPNPFQGQTLESPNLSFTDGMFFLTLPGTGSQKYPVPEAAVVDAFKSIGVGISFEKAITADNAVVAPALMLESVLPAPPANQVYTGETPITFTIGRTSAAITGSVNPADPSAATDTAGTPATAGAAGTGVDGAASPAVTGGVPEVGAVPATGIPTVSLAPAGSAQGDRIVSTSRSGQDGQLDSIAPFYFVLIGVGLFGLLAGQALRYVGVRSAWKS